jgi:hypothetical protein
LLERLQAGDQSNEALELLFAHYHEFEAAPLLKELYDGYCQHLIEVAKARYGDAPERTLRAFGFAAADSLFENEKLQTLFEQGLITQARSRSQALIRVGELVEDAVTEAMFLQEFQRVAGAQCFAARTRLCKEFLGVETVPPNLVDVTAWRAAVIRVLDDVSGYTTREDMQRLLENARPHATNAPPPARRRQRYIR